MLNIKYIQENKKVVKHSIKARELDVDVDLLLQKYEEWKKIKKNLDGLRRKRNFLNEKVNKAKKQKKDFKKLIEQSRENNVTLKEKELGFRKLDEVYNNLIYKIPNILHKDVPITYVDRVDWESEIKKPKFDFKAKRNWEILLNLDLADFKRAIKAAGDRAWMLKGDAARLNRAITNFTLDF